ncbi:outer membrane protein assembly factor BamB [Morganella morganii]|mgnify:FL=1|uniref:outer membrane protein assembly factor BamB n=1 Tax=Morganella morganii TaxID=582 RepID=UPI00078898AC|nr:outer membrane protein assembly factor BamB [Morganella morganii]EKV4235438.1 outer membrane protein assembly factor BamB [Morganella morganii]ELL8927173.1 outer membrane protein assembly factor BamB [Morganella morganii]ELY4881903.1 outer membrane protein assembly factor BamB [Morganella morganii]MBS9569259.1 outer membrane protein assembly factor BamB [Morganella morganii subsp. morganii]MBT0330555.1 outer membrane protein assembly factor BamB [Morganella morganii subsp. morganii]
MQLRKTLLVGLVASVLLAGCSSEQDTIVMSPLPEVTSQFTPETVWDKSVGDGVGKYYSHLSPAWEGSSVYAADRNGLVKALDTDSGVEIWSVNLAEKTGFLSADIPAMLSGGLTVSGEHVYVGTERGTLIALNANDGEIAWTANAGGEVLSRPEVSDGLVLVHTGNGLLQAFDTVSGEQRWSLNLDTPSLSVRGESAPAVAMGAAFVGGDNGRVSAVMLGQGQIIWQQRISQTTGTTEISRLNDVDMTPVVADGRVYAIAYNGNLVAMDMRSGQILWKRDFGSVNELVLDGESLYVVDQDDNVYGLRAADGVTMWSQDKLLHRNLSAPEIFNGYLVVGDGEGYLHWLDTSNGQFVAQNKLNSSGILSRPSIAGDKLMVQARDGRLYLLRR